MYQTKWQKILKSNFTDWKKLACFLKLSKKQQKQILKASNFPLNLPLRLAKKIEKGTLHDPILRQFLPTIKETKKRSRFVDDPLLETFFLKSPLLLQKYPKRVLLLTSTLCAQHCRFCFRKCFSFKIDNTSLQNALVHISNDSSVQEVILSGGDPLSLTNRELDDLLTQISLIPHIKRIRFHTKFLISIPERLDKGLIKILKKNPLAVWFVIHVNHPKELDDFLFDQLAKLQKIAIPILSQSVLLKGINDNLKTLKELFETLINHGVIPYYLHQLDPIERAHHFEVPIDRGQLLMKKLAEHLPGYAVPKYVQEIPCQLHKTVIK